MMQKQQSNPAGPSLSVIADLLRMYADVLDGNTSPRGTMTLGSSLTQTLNAYFDANPEKVPVLEKYDQLSRTSRGLTSDLFGELLGALAAIASEPDIGEIFDGAAIKEKIEVAASELSLTLRQEANALTGIVFRNGFLEDLHAGRHSELLENPEYSRITNDEMKRLMVECSRKLYEMLRSREENPDRYMANIAYAHGVFTKNWDQSE